MEISQRQLSRIQGYNHYDSVHVLDVTGLPECFEPNEEFKQEIIREARVRLERPGIAGCYRSTIQSGTYKPVTDEWGTVHRFTFRVYTTGSD